MAPNDMMGMGMGMSGDGMMGMGFDMPGSVPLDCTGTCLSFTVKQVKDQSPASSIKTKTGRRSMFKVLVIALCSVDFDDAGDEKAFRI